MISQLTDAEIDRLAEKLAKKLTRFLKELVVTKPEFLSVKDAAIYCGMSVDHVREQIHLGRIPANNISSNDRPTYRVSVENLDKFMVERQAEPLCPPSVRRTRQESLPVSPHLGRKRKAR